MRRIITLVTFLGVILTLSLPAFAANFDPNQMVFPVDGEHSSNYDNFGACRGSGCPRTHEGNDIMAAKGTPLVAVGDGVIRWISDPGNTSSVYLGIDHGNGWLTRYIHMNNDSEGTDDGQVYGIAPGLVYGSVVTAGQLIGWVGDSGNAEGAGSHLHFELRRNPDGGHGDAVDPNPYLVNAESNWTGQFRDDDGSVHENNIDEIYLAGITVGCNPPLDNKFCPHRSITRGEMAAFIARALSLGDMTGTPAFDDLEGHLFENAIDKIVTAEIGFGCTETSFCPDRPLLREEMAELLVRAFGYENPDGIDFFVDDDGNPFEASINKLANHRITVGCNPPDNDRFCPDRTLTRAEMATFFVRALNL